MTSTEKHRWTRWAARGIVVFLMYSAFREVWNYLFLPLGEDQKIFMGGAKAAGLGGDRSLFSSALHTWELKPFVNRWIGFSLFQGAAKLSDPASIRDFEISVRIVSSVCIAFTAWLFAFSKWFSRIKWEAKLALAALICFIYVTSSHEAALQTEEYSIAVILLAAVLAAPRTPPALLISGFLSSCLFYMKGIELLNAAFIPALILTVSRSHASEPDSRWKELCWFAAGGVLGLGSLTAIVFLAAPSNWTDLIEVAQNRFSGKNDGFYKMFEIGFRKTTADVPFFACLLIAFPFAVIRCLQSRSRVLHATVLILFLSIAIAIVYLKRGFFTYHYLSFVPLLLFAILYGSSFLDAESEKSTISHRSKSFYILSGIVIALTGAVVYHFFMRRPQLQITNGKWIFFALIALVLTFEWIRKRSPLFFTVSAVLVFAQVIGHFREISRDRLWNYQKLSERDAELHQKLDVALKIPKNEKVLYLADGMPNYYLPHPTACRHFFPVVRFWNPESSSAKEFQRCLEAYVGDYVFLNPDWYRMNARESQWLNSKYVKIYEERMTSRPLLIYRRR